MASKPTIPPSDNIIAIVPNDEQGKKSTIKILYLEEYEDGSTEFKISIHDSSDIPLNNDKSVTCARSRFLAESGSDIHVVISTLSGVHQAASFFKHSLKPCLSAIGVTEYQVHETESAHTIVELCQTLFLPRALAGHKQTIILLSGDGGLVDLIKVFSTASENHQAYGNRFEAPYVALIPMGTGNAAANSTGVLRDATWGLSTLVHGEPQKLPVFRVTLSPGSVYLTEEGRRKEAISSEPGGPAAEIYGAVVLSWGMHASLVADSDTSEYRKFGASRFQMAAKELMYPSDGSPTHNYRGRVTFIKKDPKSSLEMEERIDREEHMYVLVTMMSQLEKGFTISPSSKPLDGQLRLIHFGPIGSDLAMSLVMKAYQGGGHIKDNVVGYEAIEGLRIQFDEEEERWRRICIDGKIVAVEKFGWLEVQSTRRHLLDLVVPSQ